MPKLETMRHPFSLLLAAVLLLPALLHADPPPPLLAAQAAAIAQADLESRGLQDKIFIEQINFKKGGVIGGDPDYWEVLWSESFPAQMKGRSEIGLRVTMDGNYKRSVR